MWVSVDIQAKYGKRLKPYLERRKIQTATIEAVKILGLAQEDYEMLMEQWSYLDEIVYSGSYSSAGI